MSNVAREESELPLAGCLVVEAARFVTGPLAAQMLADLGADVIKIEDPRGGDPFRGWGRKGGGYGPPFLAFNRSKRSLTLDLRKDDAVRVLHRLASKADVFIENFRPGVADRLGIGYSTLSSVNPRLVYCAISGMGREGPWTERPAYDGVGQGLSGLMSLIVDMENPKPAGPTFSDTLTGLYASYGILAALQGRERTGRGQMIETSLLQATIGFMHEPFASYFGSGTSPDAYDRPRASLVFAFICRDGLPLVVHLSSPEKFWTALVQTVGRTDMLGDERLISHALRQRNWHYVQAELEPIFRQFPRAEWLERLHAADVPVAPINRLGEVVEDELASRHGMFQMTEHPRRGEVRMVGFPVAFSSTPLPKSGAPPELGEHSRAVLSELGYDEKDIAALLESAATG